MVQTGHLPLQVLITPLTSAHTIQQQRNFAATKSLNSQPSSHNVSKVDKVLLKAVNKKGKKDPKTFTLHNIDQQALLTCDNLKVAIRRKLSDDITTGDFDVGYVQGTTVVRVRTSDDLEELWSSLRQPQKNTVLWCNGLIAHAGHKQKHSDDDEDSDTEQQSRKSRNKKHDTNVQQVQDTVDQLKAKYGSSYTQMQFRIWAELIVGGMCSMDGPPANNSMFMRTGAGGGTSKKRNESPATQALTDAITAALSAKDAQESQQSTLQPSTSISSPAKLI